MKFPVLLIVFGLFLPSCENKNAKKVINDIVQTTDPGFKDVPDATDARDVADIRDADSDITDAEDIHAVPDITAREDIRPDTTQPWALPEHWKTGKIIRTCERGLLAVTDSPSGPMNILVLTGSHFQMGYEHGCLMGKEVAVVWQEFINHFIDTFIKEVPDLTEGQIRKLLIGMMDTLWTHMSPFVSPELIEEMNGYLDGARAMGVTVPGWPLETSVRGVLLISNISDMNWSGTMDEILATLNTGYSKDLKALYKTRSEVTKKALLLSFLDAYRHFLPFRTSCSFFAAWGSRTMNGHCLASRNLDWSSDTGLSGLRAITIYAPDNANTYATIGYAGFR